MPVEASVKVNVQERVGNMDRSSMNHGSRWLRQSLVGALIVVGLNRAPCAFAAGDTVTLKDGKTQDVTVLSEDYDGVWYNFQKAQSRFNWADIVSIRYTGATDYYKALDAVAAGKLNEAVPALEKLAGDAKTRAPLRHGALYALGMAYQRSGDLEKAIADYQELLKSFPKSHYLMQVGANLIGAHLTKGDVASAAKALDDFLAGAKSAGIEAKFQTGFGLLRARVLEEQKKYPDAQALYSGVAGDSSLSVDIVAAGKLGVGRCLLATNKKPEAEKLFREITAVDAENTVLAGAWNGLGDLALDVGTEKRDLEKLNDALFCYLRGVVLYGPTRDESTDEYERSLAQSAKAFRSIGEVEKDAEKKKLFLDRAAQRTEQLKQQFPTSRYLKAK